MTTLEARDFQALLQRIQSLLHEVDRFANPTAQEHVRELVQAILTLHGTALQRLLEGIEKTGDGRTLLETVADDDMVGGLLLLHGLHPLDVDVRVRKALESVRPALRSHGGNVELLLIPAQRSKHCRA